LRAGRRRQFAAADELLAVRAATLAADRADRADRAAWADEADEADEADPDREGVE